MLVFKQCYGAVQTILFCCNLYLNFELVFIVWVIPSSFFPTAEVLVFLLVFPPGPPSPKFVSGPQLGVCIPMVTVVACTAGLITVVVCANSVMLMAGACSGACSGNGQTVLRQQSGNFLCISCEGSACTWTLYMYMYVFVCDATCTLYVQVERTDSQQVWSTNSASSGGYHSSCTYCPQGCIAAQIEGEASKNCIRHCGCGCHVQTSSLSAHNFHWKHLCVSVKKQGNTRGMAGVCNVYTHVRVQTDIIYVTTQVLPRWS